MRCDEPSTRPREKVRIARQWRSGLPHDSQMTRTSTTFGICAAGALALAGCGGTQEPSAASTITVTSEHTVTVTTTERTASSAVTTATSATPTPATSTATETDQPINFTLYCKVGEGAYEVFETYQAAWAAPAPTDNCSAQDQHGADFTAQQQAAVATAYGPTGTVDQLDTLFSLCGEVQSYYVREGIISDSQASEAAGMLLLCPDHPSAAILQQRIEAIRAQGQADQARIDAIAAGTYAAEGSHLVGSELRPGTWRSMGDKVEDCYWEISDSTGEIIDNNFISIAPQFELSIPSSAAGFTNSGCEFERIGD